MKLTGARYLLIITFCLFIQKAKAQSEFTYFSKSIVSDTMFHLGAAIEPIDEGFMVLGLSNSLENVQGIFLSRLNSLGDVEWKKEIASDAESFTEINIFHGGQMVVGHDDNVIVIYSRRVVPFFGFNNVVIESYTFDGELEWSYESSNDYEAGNGTIERASSGYVAVYETALVDDASIPRKLEVVKLSDEGEEEWLRPIEVDDPNIGMSSRSIIAHSNGTFYLAGAKWLDNDALPGSNNLIIKLDDNGEILWEKEYHNRVLDQLLELVELENGEIFGEATNLTYDPVEFSIQYPTFFRFSEEGEVIDKNELDFTDHFPYGHFGFPSICRKGDDIFLVGIWVWEPGIHLPLWLVKTDAQLDTIQTSFFSWDEFLHASPSDIEPTSDGGLIATGLTIPTLDSTGNAITPQIAWMVKMDSLGNTCNTLGCDSTVLLSSIDLETILDSEKLSITIAPNPASTERVSVKYDIPDALNGCRWHLFDAQGIEKRSQLLPSGQGYSVIPLRYCTPGFYSWILEINGKVLGTGKVLLQSE